MSSFRLGTLSPRSSRTITAITTLLSGVGTSQTLTGKVPAGATGVVIRKGGTQIATATPDASGAYSAAVTGLSNGDVLTIDVLTAGSVTASITATADITILGGGQSNGVRLVTYAQSQFETALSALYTATPVHLVNGATEATSLLLSNGTTTNSWWNDTTSAPNTASGSPWNTWLSKAQAELSAGRTVPVLLWDQGENDQGSMPGKKATYKAALVALFGQMRAIVGNVPVVIVPIGRRGDGSVSANPGYQVIRAIQKEVAAENAWITLAPEKYDQPDDGGPHLSTAGYQAIAPRIARSVAKAMGLTVPGGVRGPVIAGAVRNGTSVVVTLSHDTSATDFTPTTGITGFRYFDNGAEIAVTAAVRTNATTVTLTLASAPTGSDAQQNLDYGYGILNGDAYANMLRDNQSVPLPLRNAVIVPTNATVGVPANTVAPAITGTPQVGQTLTTSNGTWTNSPTAYAYQWNRAGSPISGATGSTYQPVSGDVGSALTCTVTASNTGGSGTPATSAATAAVTAAGGGGATTFSDDFNGGSGNLSARSGWTQNSGAANAATIASDKLSFASGPAVFEVASTGAADCFAKADLLIDGNSANYPLAIKINGADCMALQFSGGSVKAISLISGTVTAMTAYATGLSNPQTVRAYSTGASLYAVVGGTTYGPWAIPASLQSSTKCGVLSRNFGSGVLDNFSCGTGAGA